MRPDPDTAEPAASPSPSPRRPHSIPELFWALTVLALQGFGGVLVVVQRELVERKQWLTREEFVENWAVAQILPGPNVVNLSIMLGDRYFGWRGALAALAGILVFPLLSVLVLAALFAGIADHPAAQGALRGMSIVVAGMITATALKLGAALKSNVLGAPAGWGLAAIVFIAIGLWRLPLAAVLLVLGGPAGFWAYRRLGRTHKADA